MKHFVTSLRGRHAVNEDYVIVRRQPDGAGMLICALADGQGGRTGGAEASRTACESMIRQCESIRSAKLMKERTWIDMGDEADRGVRDDPEAGFTTLIGLAVSEQEICGTASGDSAAYLMTTDGITCLTTNQRKNPPVGSGGADFVSFKARLIPPWKLLVMSDGVWKYGGIDGMRELNLKQSGEEVIEHLMQKAQVPGTRQYMDDFTLVVISSD